MEESVYLDDQEISKKELEEKAKEAQETKSFKLKEVTPDHYVTLNKLKE